jgi:hypothetical protein
LGGAKEGSEVAMTGGLLGLVGLVIVMLLFRMVGSAFSDRDERRD